MVDVGTFRGHNKNFGLCKTSTAAQNELVTKLLSKPFKKWDMIQIFTERSHWYIPPKLGFHENSVLLAWYVSKL
jgi:hypothetical protein